ncbi:MAG: hypothetical protein H6618_10385 [Deltaproteobacteria bacterium]|nr:hypothetical protein [Deltaproteobacteria bacterium]
MGEPAVNTIISGKNKTGDHPNLTADEFSSLLDNAPVNIMYCNRDLDIIYVNKTSLTTLEKIQAFLPVPVDQVLGSNIDIFHKNPSHQRKMLANDKNFPHKALITVGDETLELLVNAVYREGKYVGTMVTWDIVTERLKQEDEITRVQQMIENAPINIMMAGTDYNIVYMNPQSRKTLTQIQHLLPIPVDKIVGSSIDVFHKNPAHQRKLLKDDSNLPHNAKIKLADETLDLMATAIYDKKGDYVGIMVTWSVITEKVRLVQNLSEAATQLAAAAEQLRATASQMSENSDSTTSQASSAASAAEEVSKGVESVAANTEEMNASIKEISRSVNESSKQTGLTKKQTDATNKMIEQLGSSSQEIGNVIKVISSIAQQTNLLALNATIEAARAGDAGKGFAVVANEVKELAKQTANATEEITQKIGNIQSDTSGAVDAIRSISESIDKLNGIATSIAASVEEQMSTTNEVSRIVQESNQGVRSITENVKEVSMAAQNTSEGSLQLVEAANGLLDLSERMQALVKSIEV